MVRAPRSALLSALVLAISSAVVTGFALPQGAGLDGVLRWVQEAHSALSVLDSSSLMAMVPYIIVAGDQGVGKSMTINRIVNAEIFPMRSKEQADKDTPQTTIATVYHVRRRQGGGGAAARLSVTLPAGSPVPEGCEPRDVALVDLASEIGRRQGDCFQDCFELDATIVVEYASPNATDISIVDLPGIQHTGDHAGRTKQLTRAWLEKYRNSIVVAVVVAERQLQQEVVGLLGERRDQYRGRTVLVVTKPHSIPSESKKVLNLVEEPLVRDLCGGRVAILRSADTSTPDEAMWSLEEQQRQEEKWFAEHPAYRSRPERWGISSLVVHVQEMYLRRACSHIPEIQLQLWDLLERSQQELQTLRPAASEDALIWDVASIVEKRLQDDVLTGPGGALLSSTYRSFLQDKDVKFNWDSRDETGLPIFGMSLLSPEHAFFEEWLLHARGFMREVNTHLLSRMGNATRAALREAAGVESPSLSDHRLVRLTACGDGSSAVSVVRRTIMSLAFVVPGEYPSLEDGAQQLRFRQDLPKKVQGAVLRMVIMVCVWEPIWDLQRRFREEASSGALRIALARDLDAGALQTRREVLTQRVATCHALTHGHDFDCPV